MQFEGDEAPAEEQDPEFTGALNDTEEEFVDDDVPLAVDEEAADEDDDERE